MMNCPKPSFNLISSYRDLWHIIILISLFSCPCILPSYLESQLTLCGQQNIVVMEAYVVQARSKKALQTPPCSLGSLILGEASYPAMRTSSNPWSGPHGETLSCQPTASINFQPCEWATLEADPPSRQVFRWLQPQTTSDSNHKRECKWQCHSRALPEGTRSTMIINYCFMPQSFVVII